MKKTSVSGFSMPSLGEFLNRFIPRQIIKSDEVYSYGPDNKLPQEIVQLTAGCAALLKALRLRAKYIAANGFADNGDFIVDEHTKKTANELLSEIAFSKAQFGSVALYIMRDLKGNVRTVQPTAHELIRRRLDGNFEINAKWGQKDYKKQETVIYPAFTSLDDTSKIGKFKHEGKVLGEILYHWKKDSISYYYPIPDWFAGEMDARTSSELAALDLEMAVNSFMTSGILTLVGEFDDEQTDENGRTYFQQVQSMLNQFTGASKSPTNGLSDRNRMMLVTAKSKDEVPVLQTFPIDKLISGSIEKREAVDRLISMNCGVNPVLLGYDAATTLGNTQAIANASQELANNVISDQADIAAAFKMLWPDMDWNITRFSPITYIPTEVWGKMTDEEVRATAGLEPLETSTPSESDKVLQTLSTLSPLLSAEIVKRMSNEDLFKLIGFKPDKTP